MKVENVRSISTSDFNKKPTNKNNVNFCNVLLNEIRKLEQLNKELKEVAR